MEAIKINEYIDELESILVKRTIKFAKLKSKSNAEAREAMEDIKTNVMVLEALKKKRDCENIITD